MRKLIVFNHVTLDGYFVDRNGDMTWAHNQDAEWNAFAAENASGGGELVFGRITYEMMASFWPTPQAIQSMPIVAEGMNKTPKVVFSRTLDQAAWNNTKLVKGDIAAEVRRMKKEPGPGMAILGSGSIVSQLAQEGLIDEFQIVVNPVVLGKGRTMFDGINETLALKQTKTRTFGNGNVLLCYEPIHRSWVE
jgi:dihydrofolate reductase